LQAQSRAVRAQDKSNHSMDPPSRGLDLGRLTSGAFKRSKPDSECERRLGSNDPYISFVVTARNDDHGGNLLYRMNIFVRALLCQARKENLRSELILVEWNPPLDRPRLHEVLDWPREKGPCNVRVIEVPSDLHVRFRHSDRLPLFQMIAKNVGIRRARGRFILATNIDLLFSDQLVKFFASHQLSPDFMYRIDRYDVPADVPRDASVEDQLEYCRDSVIRLNRRDGTFPREALSNISLWKIRRRNALLLQRLQSRLAKGNTEVRRILSQIAQRFRGIGQRISPKRKRWRRILEAGFAIGIATAILSSQILLSVSPILLNRVRVAFRAQRWLATRYLELLGIFLSIRLFSFSSTCITRFNVVKNFLFPDYPRLHMNGCGDFTLMASEHWNALRGYPESEMFSFNLDSVLCQMAYQHGLREKVLQDPMRVYHVDHSSGWTPEGERKMVEWLRRMRIPMLSFEEFRLWATQMQRNKRPMVLANEDWGMASYNLHEIALDFTNTVP